MKFAYSIDIDWCDQSQDDRDDNKMYKGERFFRLFIDETNSLPLGN